MGSSVPEMFGSLVFNDDVMRDKLPKDIYKSLRKSVTDGKTIDKSVAAAVANAMKDWAVDKGATHYTHWFQPMTGVTAEKHDSFISPTANGRIIMEFSGKELIRGEPDASSFPSGGLRATFEARGYTAWDPTAYAFIKDNTLCIPTIFCSYSGEALDKKTPLLRSMEVINEQALRVLRLFGNHDVNRVITTVGAEQEYFLIDKSLYDRRKDLIFCGRTLFGARPPKGQELEDHYFGAIKPRIAAFMKELDAELWKLGVLAKTEHNEAAPSQHELAPIFTTTNIATDHNQLTMELMKKIAGHYDLVCLLHEKPFNGVNGSGKHNNWSLSTDLGTNLLEPGSSPYENAQFLLFLAAVIKGVDEYQDLLRLTVATAGNDHRLGANEAPPAIVSMYIGSELDAIIESIINNTEYDDVGKSDMKVGVHTLPPIPKDTTDRNRTSPFAFTGNKFEFRMLGSSLSLSGPNIALNTIIAEELRIFADELEGVSQEMFTTRLHEIIRRTFIEHSRIIFNGDGYSAQWTEEAKKRGLLNLQTAVDALPYFVSDKNVELFTRHKIFTAAEIRSRYEILMQAYVKNVNIEAMTMIEMVRRDILPAAHKQAKELADSISSVKAVMPDSACESGRSVLDMVSKLADIIYYQVNELENLLTGSRDPKRDIRITAEFYRDKVVTMMESLRVSIDELETQVSSELWPYPTYAELLFRI